MTALRIPRAARERCPSNTEIVRVERMSPAFTKFYLADGRVLHRFRKEEPHADPHDPPWSFETTIVDGGYAEEVFTVAPDGSWRYELVQRHPGETYRVPAKHIHRIVELPAGECWTIVRSGSWQRTTRFWRFGDVVQSRAWNERHWTLHA